MKEYWETRFKNEGAMWKFYPSDSALSALELFKTEGLMNILVPGFGYGRNAKLFLDQGFDVTGIEISKSAINIAKKHRLDCIIHHGSVSSMPFDNRIYDGIFCYALVHLLNRYERQRFIKNCNTQLKPCGIMIFVIATIQNSMFGTGKYISKNRYEINNGLKVYFYDSESVKKEFSEYGITESRNIQEPIKFTEDQDPINLQYIVCKKPINTIS